MRPIENDGEIGAMLAELLTTEAVGPHRMNLPEATSTVEGLTDDIELL